jgi:hypothetical protein
LRGGKTSYQEFGASVLYTVTCKVFELDFDALDGSTPTELPWSEHSTIEFRFSVPPAAVKHVSKGEHVDKSGRQATPTPAKRLTASLASAVSLASANIATPLVLMLVPADEGDDAGAGAGTGVRAVVTKAGAGVETGADVTAVGVAAGGTAGAARGGVTAVGEVAAAAGMRASDFDPRLGVRIESTMESTAAAAFATAASAASAATDISPPTRHIKIGSVREIETRERAAHRHKYYTAGYSKRPPPGRYQLRLSSWVS